MAPEFAYVMSEAIDELLLVLINPGVFEKQEILQEIVVLLLCRQDCPPILSDALLR